jgi:hypothetical protein
VSFSLEEILEFVIALSIARALDVLDCICLCNRDSPRGGGTCEE